MLGAKADTVAKSTHLRKNGAPNSGPPVKETPFLRMQAYFWPVQNEPPKNDPKNDPISGPENEPFLALGRVTPLRVVFES